MIRRFFRSVFMLTIASTLTGLAQAQSMEQLMLLQSNPDLAQQFQQQLEEQKKSKEPLEIGVPTSGDAQVLNTDDAVKNPSLLVQSTAPDAVEESVIQRYYRILAGDVLPIYGAQEFEQSQEHAVKGTHLRL